MKNRQDKNNFSAKNNDQNYHFNGLFSRFLVVSKVFALDINHQNISTHEKLQIIYANIRV